MDINEERQNPFSLNSSAPSFKLAKASTSTNTSKKTSTKSTTVKSPSPTLKKQSEHNLLVLGTDGKKHRIYFVTGVPASISGIGSLSKTYTKPFSSAQIALIQEAAYKQSKDLSQKEYEDNYNSWIKNTATSPFTGEADDAVHLVHYRKSLTDEPMAYVDSRSAQDSKYGKYNVESREITSGGSTYNGITNGYDDLGIFNTNPNYMAGNLGYRYVHKDIVPKKDYQLNTEPRKLAYSDYSELYSRGKGGNREKIHQAIQLIDMNQGEYLTYSSKYYNRFKVAIPDSQLQRAFAHVFFIKPQCNVKINDGLAVSGNEAPLDQVFAYTWNHSPEVVREIAGNMTNSSTDFSFMLSNAAMSFSLSDEYIDYDSYGVSYRGYKISFGRHDAESKTAGEFTVTFNDDNNFNIYRLVKLWVDYISGTYRGIYSPKDSTIKDNIIDYAGACYYILTAEDGETILFWSKYYGVFPTTVPSNQYSWSSGTLISMPQLDVKFAYSFKEDYKMSTIVEFNRNANVQRAILNNSYMYYEKTFDPKLGSVGKTWVGAPFIESEIKNGVQTLKLRFRQPS